jgi:hypothetical protein
MEPGAISRLPTKLARTLPYIGMQSKNDTMIMGHTDLTG